MARVLINGFGPTINEALAYYYNGGASVPSGFSIASSPAPPHGSYWLQRIGNAAGNLPIGRALAYAEGTRQWLVIRGWRIEGTLSANELVEGVFSAGTRGSIYLNANGQSDGTYKIRARISSTDYDSTSTYSVSTTHNIRVSFDGSTITVEVDGTEEISVSSATKWHDHQITFLKGNVIGAGSDATIKLSGVLLVDGDDGDDRPGVAVEVDKLTPTSEGSYDDWAGDWSNWDDYAGAGTNDGDTTFNAGKGGQTSNLDTHTPTDVIAGVIVYARARGPTKSPPNWFFRIADGTSTLDDAGTVGDTGGAYWSKSAVFPTAPDTGAWTQTDVNALQAGLNNNTATNNLTATAVSVELFSVDDDPEPAPPAAGAPARMMIF